MCFPKKSNDMKLTFTTELFFLIFEFLMGLNLPNLESIVCKRNADSQLE